MRNPDRRVEDAEVIVDLRRRGDGGARIRRGDPLLDRDRGGEPLDVIDLRLLHLVEELAGVGGETLHVTTLPLGKKRIEGE